MRSVAAALLVLEAIAVLLGGLLAATATDVSTALVWSVFGGIALLCVLGAGTMRRGLVGWVIGTIAQVGAVASGLLVPAMAVIGLLFGGLWVLTYVLGRRLDAAAAAASRG